MAKLIYAIISGEGEVGTIETATLTPVGIKRRLTIERCDGDRWAWAVQIPTDMTPDEAIEAGKMGQLAVID